MRRRRAGTARGGRGIEVVDHRGISSRVELGIGSLTTMEAPPHETPLRIDDATTRMDRRVVSALPEGRSVDRPRVSQACRMAPRSARPCFGVVGAVVAVPPEALLEAAVDGLGVERSVGALRALRDDERTDLDVGQGRGRDAGDRVGRRRVDVDGLRGPVEALDRDGRAVDGRDLAGHARDDQLDLRDRVGPVGVPGLGEADLVADLEVRERDRRPGAGDGRVRGHGDRPRPAVGGLEREVGAVDRGDRDLAEAEAAATEAEGAEAEARAAACGREARSSAWSRARTTRRPMDRRRSARTARARRP